MWSSSSFKASSLVLLALMAAVTHGFYMPGVTERTYKTGERIDLMVNKLTSAKTQLPYKYYTPLLSFCKPAKLHDKSEILGEILRGDKIENSLYEVLAIAPGEPPAKETTECKIINDFKTFDDPARPEHTDPEHSVGNSEDCTNYRNKQLKHFKNFIKEAYRVQWIMDNLPAAYVRVINGKKTYETGFLLGETVAEKPIVNNHVDITVVYGLHQDGIVVIGFEVKPYSIDHSPANTEEEVKKNGGKFKCAKFEDGTLSSLVSVEPLDSDQKATQIYWSYRVFWEKTETPWTKRWDLYLASTGAQIHWISIVNSLMIVLFLTGMVAMIMMRTLRADLRRYNQQDLSDDEGETGWKLVHGDVFRPPSHPMALAVLIGSGVQVFGMTVVTMSFAVLGFLSPAQRGMLVTAFVVLFVFMGVFAGYFATRCYKIFKGTHWKRLTLNTAFAFPGTIFVIFFILNICEWAEKSSGGIPFGTLVSLMALWFGISVPLVFFGSYFGQRKPLPEDPVRTNQIPRQVPEQVWYMSPLLSILMGGILPFGAVFIELFFILSSLWGNQLYYIFGFLFIVFVILILTCAEITVVMCYFQLCAEDYHWWWRSFLTAGASAFYMFLYSIFYFATSLDIDKFVSVLLYFGYTLMMAIAFFVLTGTIGFYACYYFVRKIYSSIHVD